MTSGLAFDWTATPLGPGVTVVHAHPCGLTALAKPAGVLAHPNCAADRPRSLLTAPFSEEEECFSWSNASTGAMHRVWLLHRLDSATSGIVLVATRVDTAAVVRESFAQRQVTKKYIAIVLGHPRERRALWRDALEVRRGPAAATGRGVRVRAADGGGLRAETAMRVVRLIPGPPALAVVELEPRTGRTHQLRHQCARRHLPILGDQNYGNFPLNRTLARRFGTDRLFLHAQSVQLEVMVGKARVRFAAEAPAPPEFALRPGH